MKIAQRCPAKLTKKERGLVHKNKVGGYKCRALTVIEVKHCCDCKFNSESDSGGLYCNFYLKERTKCLPDFCKVKRIIIEEK